MEIQISQEIPHASLFSHSKDYILAVLAGEKEPVGHIAIGEGTITATKLGEEVGRRAIYEVLGAPTGSIERTFRAYFEPTYPTKDVSITEIALYGDSTSTLGSGTAIAAVSVSPPILKRVNVDSLWVNYKLYYST